MITKIQLGKSYFFEGSLVTPIELTQDLPQMVTISFGQTEQILKAKRFRKNANEIDKY